MVTYSVQSTRTRADSIVASQGPETTHCAVFINVYDLPSTQRSNKCMSKVGIGCYHTAIQVGKIEFTFGGNIHSQESGIYISSPRRNNQFIFKYAIPVFDETNPEESVLTMSEHQICYQLVPRMGQRYIANTYDILLNNCNHFTENFLREITGRRFGLPSYLNRAAYLGSFFHCFVP